MMQDRQTTSLVSPAESAGPAQRKQARARSSSYLLFAEMALFCWAVAVNPITVAWLYTSDNHIDSVADRAILWCASGGVLALMLLLWWSRWRWRTFTTAVSVLLLLATPALAWVYWHSNPNRHHWDSALTAQEALSRISVPDGFHVELIAAEPDLINPVALAFDDRGRAWVSESVEYPRRSPGPGQDSIKILEDTNGDGRADKVTVFADKLNMPTGLAIGYGGVWVLNAPDLLYFQDTDGDGRADRREVILTGFGRKDSHELPSNLSWGPDGWLYGLNGISNPSRIDHQGQRYEFSCAMYRLHPRTRKFEVFCEGTSNPWGLAWNEEGSAFVSTCVIDHLWQFAEGVYYQNQSGLYPPHTWPAPSIVDHKHQSAAYCGLEYYDSDAYPSEYRKRLYMGNLHGGCLNVDILTSKGATYTALPGPDFLTAHDGWFMPVSIKTGPDGCLHVLDWYDRYHCHQDAERDPAGIDRMRGRLYRVRYGNSPHVPPRNLAELEDAQLVELLASGNAYLRRTALRLLQERLSESPSPELQTALEAFTFDARQDRRAQLLAFWALLGGNALRPEFHLRVLGHPDSALTAWGVRAAGDARQHAPELLERIRTMASIPDPVVQAEILIAMRKIKELNHVDLAMDVLEHSPADTLLPYLAWRALAPLLPQESTEFRGRAEEIELNRAENLAVLLPRAMNLILESNVGDLASIDLLLSFLNRTNPSPADQKVAAEGLRRLTARVQSGGHIEKSVAEWKSALEPALRKLLAIEPSGGELRVSAELLAASWGDPAALKDMRTRWLDPNADAIARADALDALIAGEEPAILKLVETAWPTLVGQSAPLRSRVIGSLAKIDSPEVGNFLVAHFQELSPPEQTQALELLTGRVAWANSLLAAIDANIIPANLVNIEQVRKMQVLPDQDLVERTRYLWGTVRKERNPDRAEVVARMKKILAETSGNVERGRAVFARTCSQCHRLYGQGHVLGPDLTTNGRASLDQLISNVFDPNLVIGSAYQTRLVSTEDGRVFTGLLAEEDDRQITLKLPGGKRETILKEAIDELIESRVSLMPEGMERQMKPQEVADLFAFLLQQQPKTN